MSRSSFNTNKLEHTVYIYTFICMYLCVYIDTFFYFFKRTACFYKYWVYHYFLVTKHIRLPNFLRIAGHAVLNSTIWWSLRVFPGQSFQPIISVSDGNTTLDAQQLSIRVSRGSSFIISCSIQSQHLGGFFKLFFTSSNTAHSTIQPAVHHCAHFLFPKAEPAHQGNYSCVYVVTVFSQTTFSESHVLSLTVSGKWNQCQLSTKTLFSVWCYGDRLLTTIGSKSWAP